jgi:ubiquinone/menaquinone biosynthesis C-methylase UbiE
LEFSSKYHEDEFPGTYASKHNESLSRRLNDRREQALLRRCLKLVDPVDSIIDVGCGPGRFWPSLIDSSAELAALDVSHAMLRFARERYPAAIAGRFELAAGSVTALPFSDDAFDCVVSMRLLHHFGESRIRRGALGELARISRRFVIVSLWTDGNFKAWRRTKLEQRRREQAARAGRTRSYENRHVVSRQELLEDFTTVGLHPISHYDLIPGYSQWRFYVLEHADT